jgi:hypothetical protein
MTCQQRPIPTASPIRPSTPSSEEGSLERAEEVKALYEELQEFKFDPEFQQHGFGVCCRFNEWKLAVEDLESLTGLEFGVSSGSAPET